MKLVQETVIPANGDKVDITLVKAISKGRVRSNPTAIPMPFDGRRLIFGGFRPLVELGGR